MDALAVMREGLLTGASSEVETSAASMVSCFIVVTGVYCGLNCVC